MNNIMLPLDIRRRIKEYKKYINYVVLAIYKVIVFGTF